MSVPTLDPSESPAGGMLGPVNSVMGAIFDMGKEEEVETPPEAGDETPPAAGEEPPAAGGDTEPPAAGEEPPAGTEGAEGAPAAPAAPVQPAPAVVGADDKVLVQQIGELSEKLEERFEASFRQQAVEQAQQDYPHYIEKLNMHPLELVGKELPAIDGSDETITPRTAEEVREWQEAVKVILGRELEASVAEKQAESAEVLDVVHSSIELLRDNPDIVPGSKSYNKELAKRFIKLAEPYALKMNDKLTGFSIPMQGLLNQVRAQVQAETKAGAAGGTPPAKKAAPAAKPQAGIPSAAGTSGDAAEDYSAMWGALGIKNAPI